jgi:hypothetical protein
VHFEAKRESGDRTECLSVKVEATLGSTIGTWERWFIVIEGNEELLLYLPRDGLPILYQRLFPVASILVQRKAQPTTWQFQSIHDVFPILVAIS